MPSCPWISVLFNNVKQTKDCPNNKYSLIYPCESSSDCHPFYITLFSGVYTFELYGGQGGGPLIDTGKGGYIQGTIKLNEKSSFYVFVGAHGKTLTPNEDSYTFGGGGNGYSYSDTHGVGSGGGASDIRKVENDLYSRIIVAGGGGASGKQYRYGQESKGSCGGGSNGESAVGSTDPGQGATISQPGQSPFLASFGFGSNVTRPSDADGSGGGGGYGGSAGKGYSSGGGGGSGYFDINLFYDVTTSCGVNLNHGSVHITLIKYLNMHFCSYRTINRFFTYSYLLVMFI